MFTRLVLKSSSPQVSSLRSHSCAAPAATSLRLLAAYMYSIKTSLLLACLHKQTARVPDPTPSTKQGHLPAIATGILVLGTFLLAIFYRLPTISESLWIDELHTAWTVAGPFSDIPSRAAAGNNGSLYFYAVYFVQCLFGPSEFSLRALSLVAGLMLIVGLYFVTWRWTGSYLAGLLVALLAAADPKFILYSVEARSYACVQLIALAQIALFAELMRRNDWRLRVAWGALTITMLQLHYTSGLILPAELTAYAILCCRKEWRPVYRPFAFLCDLLICGIACAVSIPHLMEIAARRDNWSAFVKPESITLSLQVFPLQRYVVVPLLSTIMVVGIPSLICRRWILGDMKTLPTRLILAGCWLIVPLLIAWVLTQWHIAPVFFIRYLIASYAASLVIAGLACGLCQRPWQRGIVCAVALLAIPGPWLEPRPEDWRGAMAYVNQSVGNYDGPVFVAAGLIEADALEQNPSDEALRRFCVLPVAGLYPIDAEPRRLEPLTFSNKTIGNLTAAQRNAFHESGEAWLIVRGPRGSAQAVHSRIRKAMLSEGVDSKIVESENFDGVQVARLVVRIEA